MYVHTSMRAQSDSRRSPADHSTRDCQSLWIESDKLKTTRVYENVYANDQLTLHRFIHNTYAHDVLRVPLGAGYGYGSRD